MYAFEQNLYEGCVKNMALNKVNLIINSRMYTLVSEESPEYMAKLGEHINEKIALVLQDGKNIMGERPIVLAALNICDEYYKLAEPKPGDKGFNERVASLQEDVKKLKAENANLRADLEEAQSAQVTMAETEAIARSSAMQKELDEAQTQIKFLEGQIKRMEEKIEQVKEDYRKREDGLLNMFNVKKND